MVLIVYQSAKVFSIEKWIFGVKKDESVGRLARCPVSSEPVLHYRLNRLTGKPVNRQLPQFTNTFFHRRQDLSTANQVFHRHDVIG